MDSTRQYAEPDTKYDSAWTTFDETLGTPINSTIARSTSHDSVSFFGNTAFESQGSAAISTNSTLIPQTLKPQQWHINLIISQQKSDARRDCVWTLLGNTQNLHQVWLGMNDIRRDFGYSHWQYKVHLLDGAVMIVCLRLQVQTLHLKAIQKYHL